MFASAQFVTSVDGERRGRNAFLYIHGNQFPIDPPTVEEVVSSLPGRLESEITEVVPGGNSVLAFLDVVAPDGTPPDVIIQVLEMAAQDVIKGDERVELARLGVAMRFHAALIAPEKRASEFRHLTGKLAQLMRSKPGPRWKGVARLTVVATQTEDGWRLQVDPPSIARIRRIFPAWRLVTVSLSADVLRELRTVSDDVVPMILASAAGLTPEQALELGGIAVVDHSGKSVRAWPDPRPSTTITEEESPTILDAARQQLEELGLQWRRGSPLDRQLLKPRLAALEGLIPKLERAAKGKALSPDLPLVNNEADLLEELRVAAS